MAFRDYLAAFLLGASAFLFPYSEAKAEDKEVKVEFQDTGLRSLPIIGNPNIEAIVKASAWTNKDDEIEFSILTEGCSIEKYHSRIFLGLQIDADPTKIKQKAYVETPKGEKEVDISSSAILQEVDKLFGKGVIKLADSVPFFSDGVDLIQWLTGKEDRETETRFRKDYRLLLRELPLHLKFIMNPVTQLEYGILLDRPLTETPYVFLKLSVEDKYRRIKTLGDMLLKCDEQKLQQTEINLPKELEKFLIKDNECIPTKFYGPRELKKLAGAHAKDSYLIKYQPALGSEENFTIYVYIFGKDGIESKEFPKNYNPLEEIERLIEKKPSGQCLSDLPDSLTYSIKDGIRYTPLIRGMVIISNTKIRAVYAGVPDDRLLNKYFGKKLKSIHDDYELLKNITALEKKMGMTPNQLFGKGGVSVLPLSLCKFNR